jgi:hypothetical protein
VHGLQVHGLQLQFGLEQVVAAVPQLQSTQVQGSQLQFGSEQVRDSVVVMMSLPHVSMVGRQAAAPRQQGMPDCHTALPDVAGA